MSPSKKPAGRKKPTVRTRTPRPDELTRECFEFISAIDDYKRRHMRSFLNDEEVLDVLYDLGYQPRDAMSSEEQLEAFAGARLRYRREHGRLFPTWSEVFELLTGLGFRRDERGTAA